MTLPAERFAADTAESAVGKSILLVIDSLGSGGAQRQLVQLAVGLAARGCVVRVFVYYPSFTHFLPELENAGIEVMATAKRSRWDWRPLLRLRGLLRKHPPDAVISFLDTPNVYTLLAAPRRLTRIVSERSALIGDRLSALTRLRYSLYARADWITCNSHHHAEHLARLRPALAPRIRCIWNGVDLERFLPQQRAAAPGQPLRLLAVGTVVANKNIGNLIRALALTRELGLDVNVTWVGKVTSAAGSQQALAEANLLLSERRLVNHWTWHGEESEMQALYPKFDALVHPSFFEGLPNVVCEALASGLPVLASRVCDHPALVADGESGILFDPHKVEDIARALSEFAARTTAERSTMGHKARQFAEKSLAPKRFVDDYLALIPSRNRIDA